MTKEHSILWNVIHFKTPVHIVFNTIQEKETFVNSLAPVYARVLYTCCEGKGVYLQKGHKHRHVKQYIMHRQGTP